MGGNNSAPGSRGLRKGTDPPTQLKNPKKGANNDYGGWLWKYSMGRTSMPGSWKMRYVVCSTDSLCYYETKVLEKFGPDDFVAAKRAMRGILEWDEVVHMYPTMGPADHGRATNASFYSFGGKGH